MLHSFHDGAHSHEDLPQILRDQIGHFFQHYKDPEPGKWARVTWWDCPLAAERLISGAISRTKKAEKSV